ncbi:hypothetical protein LCL95_04910 [Bacillus timonensis]|nr:hypothetical protein [Bacillus timonensis]
MATHYYEICNRYRGRVVNISCKDGKKHVGRIINVTRSHVYLEPFQQRNFGGFGYGYYGRGYGYGFRRPFAVPLAFISGLVLGGLFFW